MKAVMESKYQWNEELFQWERVERVQEYRGCMIETLRTRDDSDDPIYHREYRTTYPSGKVTYTRINKRACGNIKDLKEYIDFKLKYGLAL